MRLVKSQTEGVKFYHVYDAQRHDWHIATPSREEALDNLFPTSPTEERDLRRDMRRGILPLRHVYDEDVADNLINHLWLAYLTPPTPDTMRFATMPTGRSWGTYLSTRVKRLCRQPLLWVANFHGECLKIPANDRRQFVGYRVEGFFHSPLLGKDHPVYQNKDLQFDWKYRLSPTDPSHFGEIETNTLYRYVPYTTP